MMVVAKLQRFSNRAAVYPGVALGCSGLCGILLLWIALHSRGMDWVISETHADIIYSALLWHNEIPYFSFLFNGGTYFIQDPQSPLLSLTTLWVLLFGPTGGLRFAAFFWGCSGCYFTWRWLRAYLHDSAALIAGVTWVLSLGFLWRIAVGNDMFLWFASLPALLLAIDRVILEPRCTRAAVLGLLAGFLLLGPTIHTLLYLVIPATLTWCVLGVLGTPGGATAKMRVLLALLGATAIALLIAAPKIAAWLSMPMSRTFPVCDGTFRYVVDAGLALVRYFDTRIAQLAYKRHVNYAVWESAVALCPTSIVLGMLGLLVGWRGRGGARRLYVFAAVLLILGMSMATCQPLWEWFWDVTHRSFRVPTRFLVLAGFAAVIFCGLGADWLARATGRWMALWVALAITAACACALVWGVLAMRAGVLNAAAQPLWSHPERSFSRAPVTNMGFEPGCIIKGEALARGFAVTGNEWIPDYELQSSPDKAAHRGYYPVFHCAPDAARITLSHTSVAVRDMRPGAAIRMCLRFPRQGLRVFSEPQHATIGLVYDQFTMTLTNLSQFTVPLVRLTACSPVPSYAWFIAVLAVLASGMCAGVKLGQRVAYQIKRCWGIAAHLFVPTEDNVARPLEHAPRAPLVFAALVWLIILAGLMVVYFHPYRITVNADDAWPVLESAYHSLRRDGVLMWGSDRLGALHLIIAHVVLETLGLSRWVPHCIYLTAQQAVLLLVGLVWLHRSARTFLIFGPLFVLCMIQPGSNTPASFSYWLCRVGIVYPMAMFWVMLTFGLLLKLAQGQTRLRWLLPALGASASAALISSPGNAVLIGVWFMLLFVQLMPRGKAAWKRWAYCGAVLLLAYWLTALCRGMYDHSVHTSRMATPMNFNWSLWAPTMQRFARDAIRSGAFTVGMLVFGVVVAVAGTCVAVLRRLRPTAHACKQLQLTPMGAATLLCVAGVAYLVLLGANTWVHLNPDNPTYVLPPFALFIAAAAWLLGALICRWPPALILTVATVLLMTACLHTWRLRPRDFSQMYHEAQLLLRAANRQGTSLSLLGDFWIACVHSFFDPHKILAAPNDGHLIADAMLPAVLARPLVYVNFTRLPQLLDGGSPPAIFAQRHTVLVRETNLFLHLPGAWVTYRTIQPEHLMLGSNLFDHVRADLRNHATRFDDVLVMNYPEGTPCPEVFWRLGHLPRGLYLLTMTVRSADNRSPDDICVMYLFDESLDSSYPSIVVRPAQVGTEPRRFGCLICYPGSAFPATVRLYSLSRQPYLILEPGLYTVYPVNTGPP